jgi:hypothetical protein
VQQVKGSERRAKVVVAPAVNFDAIDMVLVCCEQRRRRRRRSREGPQP